ncbi:MAG: hypothetical protein O3B64_02795 [bacterium]|nr:hypothetical protein [bacterium]
MARSVKNWMPIVWFKADLEGSRIPRTYFVVKTAEVGEYEATLRLFTDRDDACEITADRRALVTAAEVCAEVHLDNEDSSEKIKILGTNLWLVNRCRMPLHTWLPERLTTAFGQRVQEALIRSEVLNHNDAGIA